MSEEAVLRGLAKMRRVQLLWMVLMGVVLVAGVMMLCFPGLEVFPFVMIGAGMSGMVVAIWMLSQRCPKCRKLFYKRAGLALVQPESHCVHCGQNLKWRPPGGRSD